MKEKMFYKAHPLIFQIAERLRNQPTFSEELLWNYLKQNPHGIKFRRQHPAAMYVLDFYAHQIRLAVEVDGDIHSNEDVKKNDIQRQGYLESLGILVIRFSNTQIKNNVETVLGKIGETIQLQSAKLKNAHSSPSGAGGLVIIPAIDIIVGKCVRLTKGDYEQKKVYNEDPVEVAKEFEGAGLTRLHLVDLDGAKEGEVKNWKVLENVASKTKLVIDFSGGISTKKNVSICFDSGAAYAAVGSIAVKNEKELTAWLVEFGVDKFIIGADVNDEKLAIKGWTETTDTTVFDLIENYKTKGVKQFFCTDISKDGLLLGTGIELYKKILNQHPSIDLIASGGVSSINDLVLLREAGCSGAIVGKAIYENKIRLSDLKMFL